MTNDANHDGSAVTNGNRADRKTIVRLLNGALATDRPRRVDSYIDYFGTGDARHTTVSSDACGEALLDGDGVS
jgi:hypothetical protein